MHEIKKPSTLYPTQNKITMRFKVPLRKISLTNQNLLRHHLVHVFNRINVEFFIIFKRNFKHNIPHKYECFYAIIFVI